MEKLNTRALNENSILVRMGDRLDISSAELIFNTIKRAHGFPVEKIVIDLSETVQLFDSGIALLMLLHSRAGPCQDHLYLANCGPRIWKKLESTSVARGYRCHRPFDAE